MFKMSIMAPLMLKDVQICFFFLQLSEIVYTFAVML